MCGIFACLGSGNLGKETLVALKILQNRGYDSAGILTVNGSKIDYFEKYISDTTSAVDKFNIPDHEINGLSIGHTRWRTNGGLSCLNAHPHLDSTQRFAIILNGIIENYKSLSSEYELELNTDSDAEVIPNLIAKLYIDNVEEAFEKAVKLFEGTCAIVLVDLFNPTKLYVYRNKNPLLVSKSEKSVYIVSESAALTTDFFDIVPEKEIVTYNMVSQIKEEFRNGDQQQNSPSPYPHWMIKEIHEQPKILFNSILTKYKFPSEHIILTGCGTSYHSALYGAWLFKQTGKYKSVQAIDATLIEDHDINKEDIVIVISQSGETMDIKNIMDKIKCYAVVNVEHSMIDQQSIKSFYCQAGREVAVASTKSFSSQVNVLGNLSGHDDQQFIKHMENFLNNPPNELKTLAKDIFSNCFILGRGVNYIIAKEAALKLKEIGYIYAEAFSGGALKHGPFALINSETTIIIIMDDKMYDTIEQIKARDGHVITVGPQKIEKSDLHISIPEFDSVYQPLVTNVAFQLLSYYIALEKGHNPDQPRNLAKTVTVNG